MANAIRLRWKTPFQNAAILESPLIGLTAGYLLPEGDKVQRLAVIYFNKRFLVSLKRST